MNEKVFKNIRKNNDTLQILFSWDWHNKSALYCNGFNSFGQTTTFELSFFQHSHSFGICFCEVCQPYRFQNAYSFGIFLCEVCQPYRFQNAYSFGIFLGDVCQPYRFRIPILLVTEIFLCEAYRFQKTSQTSDAQKNTP